MFQGVNGSQQLTIRTDKNVITDTNFGNIESGQAIVHPDALADMDIKSVVNAKRRTNCDSLPHAAEDLLKKIVGNIRVFWKCLLVEFQQTLRALRNLSHFRVIPDIPIPCEHPLPIITPISFEISMLAHQLSQFRNSASSNSIEYRSERGSSGCH